MIFFVDNDGTIIKNLPSPVYQGAANTNTIYLIAPFASGLTASVAFQLPNGIVTKAKPMTQQNSLQGIINKETGEEYSGWTYAIPSEITEYYGTVTAQFYFYTETDGMITATSATSFQVAKGVPAVLPDEPSADVYEQILSVIASLQKQLNNGAFAARAIYAWNSEYTYGANEITYYAGLGTYGAIVASLKAGNLNHVPYMGGTINAEWWKEIVNCNNTEDKSSEAELFNSILLNENGDLNDCVPQNAGQLQSWYSNSNAISNSLQNTPEENFNRTFYIQVLKTRQEGSGAMQILQTLYDAEGNIFNRTIERSGNTEVIGAWKNIRAASYNEFYEELTV